MSESRKAPPSTAHEEARQLLEKRQLKQSNDPEESPHETGEAARGASVAIPRGSDYARRSAGPSRKRGQSNDVEESDSDGGEPQNTPVEPVDVRTVKALPTRGAGAHLTYKQRVRAKEVEMANAARDPAAGQFKKRRLRGPSAKELVDQMWKKIQAGEASPEVVQLFQSHGLVNESQVSAIEEDHDMDEEQSDSDQTSSRFASVSSQQYQQQPDVESGESGSLASPSGGSQLEDPAESSEHLDDVDMDERPGGSPEPMEEVVATKGPIEASVSADLDTLIDTSSSPGTSNLQDANPRVDEASSAMLGLTRSLGGGSADEESSSRHGVSPDTSKTHSSDVDNVGPRSKPSQTSDDMTGARSQRPPSVTAHRSPNAPLFLPSESNSPASNHLRLPPTDNIDTASVPSSPAVPESEHGENEGTSAPHRLTRGAQSAAVGALGTHSVKAGAVQTTSSKDHEDEDDDAQSAMEIEAELIAPVDRSVEEYVPPEGSALQSRNQSTPDEPPTTSAVPLSTSSNLFGAIGTLLNTMAQKTVGVLAPAPVADDSLVASTATHSFQADDSVWEPRSSVAEGTHASSRQLSSTAPTVIVTAPTVIVTAPTVIVTAPTVIVKRSFEPADREESSRLC
ncbi:hypothetical protein C8T65DRAFT_745963 [Cerioporus squamosus]|nr:hypothetical protein C8T65DRAFT_745963 [Cerioporus squamosus]